jgi:hypothetical protein
MLFVGSISSAVALLERSFRRSVVRATSMVRSERKVLNASEDIWLRELEEPPVCTENLILG